MLDDLMQLFDEIEQEGKKVTDIYLNQKDFDNLKTDQKLKYINLNTAPIFGLFRGAKIHLITKQSYLYCASLDGTDRGKRIYEIDLTDLTKKYSQNKIGFIMNLNQEET